jgi:hypothetical protein
MATATPTRPAPHRGQVTPDSHDFPTRRYDLVKEFVIALVVVDAAHRCARGDLLLTRREGDLDA